MKKTIFLVVTILLFTLTACSNNVPETDLFENTTMNHIDEMQELLETYTYKLNFWHERNYPQQDFPVGNFGNLYWNIDLSKDKDTYYRHELINYNLTEHREFLTSSEMYEALYFLNVIENYTELYCDPSLKEGKQCTPEENDEKSLYFLVEDDHVYLEYTSTYGWFEYVVTFHIYEESEDSNDVIMEYTMYEEWTDLSYYDSNNPPTPIKTELTKLYYSENVVERSVSYEFDPEDENSVKTITHINNDYLTDTYIILKQTEDHETLTYFDDVLGEHLYEITKADDEFSNFSFIDFHSNKAVVKYLNDGLYYFVNLSALPKWDRLERTDNDLFNVYYDDYLYPDLNVELEFSYGEFVYFEYTSEDTVVPSDILTLQRYNFELENYSDTYFSEREDYIKNQYDFIRNLLGNPGSFTAEHNEIVEDFIND